MSFSVKNKIHYIYSLLFINGFSFLFFLFDRFFKYLALFEFKKEFLNSFLLKFKLDHSLNYNIAFGIPIPKLVMYFLIILIIGVLFYLLLKSYIAKNKYYIFILSLVLAGSISNLIDRILYGAVIDYLSFSFFEISFPVFNIADVIIVIGVFLWLLYDLNINSKIKFISK